MRPVISEAAAILFVTVSFPALAHAQMDRYDALANSPMVENRPTPDTVKLLGDELLFQRAAQTYLWALPLLNTLGMKYGSEKVFGAGYNILPVWKKRVDANTLVTTPNSDVIYALSYLDVGRDGPLVFEAGAGLQGILLDVWQRPIPGPSVDGKAMSGDVGFFGPDQGKGGQVPDPAAGLLQARPGRLFRIASTKGAPAGPSVNVGVAFAPKIVTLPSVMTPIPPINDRHPREDPILLRHR